MRRFVRWLWETGSDPTTCHALVHHLSWAVWKLSASGLCAWSCRGLLLARKGGAPRRRRRFGQVLRVVLTCFGLAFGVLGRVGALPFDTMTKSSPARGSVARSVRSSSARSAANAGKQAGALVAGNKVAAKKVAGKKVAPKKVAGKKVVGKTASAAKKISSAKKAAGTSKPNSIPRAAKRHEAKAPRPILTVSLVSLGCPKNLVDSEKMLGLLAESGLTPVSSQAEGFGGADAVVVNTCGFLEASKEESLSVIKEAIEAKNKGLIQRVVVAGCLVQRHRAKMLEWAPGIDAMVGVFDRDKIVEAVAPAGVGVATPAKGSKHASALDASDRPNYWIAANALVAADQRGMKTTGLTVNGKDGKGIGYFEDDSSRLRLTPRHYAYLRISEGCNQNCAFCTIPSIRGKMRSKPAERIVAEARELLLDGAHELLMIGQDTTSYGDDIGTGLSSGLRANASVANVSGSGLADMGGLPSLLKSLSDTVGEVSGSGWLRLMYAYPTNFTQPIIDAFAALCAKGFLIPYLDIPLQHGSDRVLSLMRRNVTRAQQGAVIRGLQKQVPGMAIRTTFISGFPGETEADHNELLDFVEEMNFENVGIFEYSHEAGTVAGTMEEDPSLAVAPEVKARRRGEVMALQQRIVFDRNKAVAAKFDEKRPLDGAGKISGVVRDVIIDAGLQTRGRRTTGVVEAGRLYQGRTTSQAPQIDGMTFVHSKNELASGEVVRCVIVDWDGYDLIARPVAELEKRLSLTVLR